ncbi:MAG TPA: NlpC/P60 family protein [Solirubrobacteraceae bacterium]|nr:NlpC/P60 family protein [Solirubrobacteraceae bacterium]
MQITLARRALILGVLIGAGALAPTPASAAVTLGNWDGAQQHQVVKDGLMSTPGGSFQGAAPLTAAQANAAMAAVAARIGGQTGQAGAGAETPPVHTIQIAGGPVTVIRFDALVVDQLGLADVASHVRSVAAAAGLNPPAYFGTEVVARYLGLRYDHPSGTDQLELFPSDPITRAEAAWSLAQVAGFGSWNVDGARQALTAFALPPMSAHQKEALRVAVSRIGYPYVWAGESDTAEPGSWMWGPQVHGGFDCSGFVWRVFKLSGLSWGNRIGGRTAAQMAQEIPHSQRLRISQLKPGDILFFGSAHFKSTATEQNVIHTGIYLGDNWVINSSGQGVYVEPLKGSWLGDSFAWGRRVIS